jgi:hypothetical protein
MPLTLQEGTSRPTQMARSGTIRRACRSAVRALSPARKCSGSLGVPRRVAQVAQEPVEFVQTHLAHEFEYMLAAATTWCACHPDRRSAWPQHLVATAEYAAFVHQRSLYEFFCGSGGAYEARAHVGHPKALESVLYGLWEKPLNTAVTHLWPRWKAEPPVINGDHLKDQVAAFASDVLGLWCALELDVPSAVVGVLRASREHAVRIAHDAAEKMGTPPLDWSLDDPFAAWGQWKWWPVGDA